MTRPAKVLILTASHLCRNPRVVKEATTLGSAGYDVTVMSVSVLDRFERLDLDLVGGRPFRRAVLDYRVAAPGTGLARFRQRSATWVARALCRWFGIESPQALGPARSLLRFARSQPADLTIVHTELPLWIAGVLILEGRRVAVDLEDWHSEDLLPSARRARPLALLRDAERFGLRHAAYASVPSESMAAALAEAYGCPRPLVLRNVFPLQPQSRLEQTAPQGRPAIVWFSQTIGPGRGLEPFLAVWAQSKVPSQVHLMGDVSPRYQAELLAALPPGRRDDLAFISPVPPDQLPARLAEFDLGLALEPHAPRNREVTTSNKLFQYLNAGLAVVATNTPGQREVLQAAPDCGLLIDAADPARWAGELDSLLGDRDRLLACQAAARHAAVTRFSWEQEAPRLLAAVERALQVPAAPPPHLC